MARERRLDPHREGGRGLGGDRYFHGRGFYSERPSVGGREITLIESESVEALFGGIIHRGGLRARILNEGVIRVGDVIRPQTS